ncbi:MAG: ATP-binding cassette domain-containing protein, partial [Muribaculaceae bacterium]|nr:ATP-binding cassette domain-containing protein [Muribaculaceae bacterium]
TNWIGMMQDIDREIVAEALRTVGMSGYARRTMDTMSDGECQRIMIARALAQDTPVILLDEPTSFLDLPGRYELVSLLSSLSHEKDKCILFSTHELDIALNLCDRIALIDGTTLYNMSPTQIQSSGLLDQFYSNYHPRTFPFPQEG